jgi:CheY-like chemotaxis protein
MNVILASEKDGQRIHNVPAYVALSAAVKASNTEQVVNLQQNITESIESDVNNLNNNSCVLGKYKILLVDDDKIVRKLLRRRFNRIFPQADITEADCGEKAIEYTSSDRHFDIIFIDQFMGDGLNGDATIRKLRENHVDSMIVGISGNSKEMCHITAGAEDFFQKPLPSQKQVVERLLRKLPPPAGWNVLVVDDSPLNCHFLKKKLYKVFTAHYTTLERAEKRLSISVSTSVKDAIFKLKGESFDLVVTGQEFSHDNHIKDLKGMDIISFVRDHSLNKNAIIVLNSAIAQSQHHPQQFDMYWPKPLPSDDRMRQTLCEELLQIKLDAKK